MRKRMKSRTEEIRDERKAAEPRNLCSPGYSPGDDAAKKNRPAVQGAGDEDEK
jgi:hypothetical protein